MAEKEHKTIFGKLFHAATSWIPGVDLIEEGIDALGGLITGKRADDNANARMDKQFNLNETAADNAQKRQQENLMYSIGAIGAEQKARIDAMRANGLNVGLMHGSGSGGVGANSMGTAPQGGAQHAPDRYAAMVQERLGIALQKSQIDVNESIAAKNIADAEYTKKPATQQAEANIANITQQAKTETLRTIGQEINNAISRVNQEIASETKEYSINVAAAGMQKAWSDVMKARSEAAIGQIRANNEEAILNNAIKATEAQIVNTLAEAMLKEASRQGVIAETANKEQTLELIRKQIQEVVAREGMYKAIEVLATKDAVGREWRNWIGTATGAAGGAADVIGAVRQ